MNELLLSEILETTKDGEWGKGEATSDSVPMRVIRGTDFSAARYGDLSRVPLRHIEPKAASRKTLKPGDILIETAGGTKDQPTGRTVLLKNSVFENADSLVTCASFSRFLRVKSDLVRPDYLFWYLQYLYQAGLMYPYHIQHTGVARFQYTQFANQVRIPLRPMYEQESISQVLNALDDKIDLTRRMNETLQAIARALFKEWFVDFAPVRARATGSVPRTLSADSANAFPNSFNADGIPVGWQVKELGELCTVGRGGSPRPIQEFMDGEIPWIKIADATAAGGPFIFETTERLKRKGMDKSVAVVPGDLILSNSATCGLPIFVELDGCIHDGWLHFKNLRSITKLYLYHVLLELSSHLVQIADGSVQKNLNTGLVSKQRVLVPDENVSKIFESIVEPIFEHIKSNGYERSRLTRLRDFVLFKLMSGEVRLSSTGKLAEFAV